ncbi:MAG: UbiA family prenyltransferase, partial [Urechidicola sp.]|nr:UbiA family prenyltransferase [Urechidicola sp.]
AIFKHHHAIISYLVFTIIGVSLGLYISFEANIPLLSLSFIIIALFLFLYSFTLKRIALVGNITISTMIGFSILIVGLLDVASSFNDVQILKQLLVLKIILAFSLFSFGINFIRELIKDIEDIDGDYATGMRTLPILLGRKRAQNFVFVVSVIFALSIIYILTSSQFLNTYILAYGFILIVLPLLYFCYKLYQANTMNDFKKLSSLLKTIMILGMLSLVII